MRNSLQLSFTTLLLLISFASVNAVLFTGALPAIANYFSISEAATQLTMTWFLIGYAIGQLIYGPLANRFGRKRALYTGIILQIISSLLCVFSGTIHSFMLLVIARFFLALGSGVGLKITFTLINEVYEPIMASKILSYLMLAFAITPGLAVMMGGYLTYYISWQSTFYAGAIYGIILFIFATNLPETKINLDLDALKLNYLLQRYAVQFKNKHIVMGGLLMGSATCFVYVFAALAPFIAMNLMHLTSSCYGNANLIPSAGLIAGSLAAAQLIKKYSQKNIIQFGLWITLISSIMMLVLIQTKASIYLSLFTTMAVCYFGLSFIFSNVSTLAMSHTEDKSHGSAVMNFINMSLVSVVVLSLSFVSIETFILPAIYCGICVFMIFISYLFKK